MTVTSLDGCKRCPTCQLVPVVGLEDKVLGQPGSDVVLRCAVHGHTAMGDDLEMAVRHWNRYITYVVQMAGRHFIENGPGKPDESYCTVCGDNSQTEDFPNRTECKRCHAVKHWKEAA
jgi:hypothetical protein